MGPKGKSKAILNQAKQAREIGTLTVSVNKMTLKIQSLKEELELLSNQYVELTQVLDSKKNEVETIQVQLHHVNTVLSEKQSLLINLNETDLFLSKKIESQRLKIRRKHSVLGVNTTYISNLQQHILPFSINNLKVAKRKRVPFSFESSSKSKKIRCDEVYSVCGLILGGKPDNQKPVLNGMMQTIFANFKTNEIAEVFEYKGFRTVSRLHVQSWIDAYLESSKNIIRSLSVYYAHDVLGKRKYLSMRKANRKSSFENITVPNFVSYPELAKYINDIDIGCVKPLYPDLVGENSLDKPRGCYRNIKSHVLRLAEFYLNARERRKDKLFEFSTFPRKDPSSFLFLLAFGGDGAPGVGTIFSISFLNAGKRILSSSETFTVFGGDVNEEAPVVELFLQQAVKDLISLEENIFSIKVNGGCVKTEFKVAELPNDMKFLSYLAGELTNSATYFTTFADVCSSTSMNKEYSFGVDWLPFSYEKRLKDVEEVEKFKRLVEQQNIKEDTKRTKITSKIASLQSRQEFVPRVLHFIDRAKCEPLHLKNNVCKEYFNKIMKEIMKISNLSLFKTYDAIPSNNIFRSFLLFVKVEMNLNMLSKKVSSWYDESKQGQKEFVFRFRGEESYGLLKHFPVLFSKFLPYFTHHSNNMFLSLFKQLLLLRKLISYSVRVIQFDENDLSDMFTTAKELFQLVCATSSSVTPSLWVLCHIAPHHANQTFTSYGLGLGINSMEPREQKHQKIKKYAENTTHQKKWELIFRHEFIQLIYLKEKGYDELNYNRKGKCYIPKFVQGSCEHCGLPLDQTVCGICSII